MPQRKVHPPKGYITAHRTKQLLGNISDGMLRTYVTKGLIERYVPDLRSHGFYKAEDVSNLATRLGIHREIVFRPGTVDDLAECDDLLVKIFGGSNPVDIQGKPIAANPIERRATWITRNPETFFILRSGRELVGCVFMLPLAQKKIQQILASEVTPPIHADDVQLFGPGVPVHLYIMSACVYASDHEVTTKRFYGSRLIHGLLSRVISLGKRGVVLATIVSRSDSKDGIALLKHVGCTEIESSTHWRDFIIDVPLSGIPDVKRYKKALRAYSEGTQDEHVPYSHTPHAHTHTGHQGSADPLPDGYIPLSQFWHGIPETSVTRARIEGKFPCETGNWKDDQGHKVNYALSPEQQRSYYEAMHDRSKFMTCPQCPHIPVIPV